jgi:hypothetical protein
MRQPLLRIGQIPTTLLLALNIRAWGTLSGERFMRLGWPLTALDQTSRLHLEE